jgi:hypothetical protein
MWWKVRTSQPVGGSVFRISYHGLLGRGGVKALHKHKGWSLKRLEAAETLFLIPPLSQTDTRNQLDPDGLWTYPVDVKRTGALC